MSTKGPIKVLIVDDSALVRKILTATLKAEADIEVVGTASDAYTARDQILKLTPDLITLDIEMPRMDGITFLRKLMKFKPLPVIVISSLGSAGAAATVEALQAGAVEVLCKPDGPTSVGDLTRDLARKVRIAACARVKSPKPGVEGRQRSAAMQERVFSKSLIAVGASTGGPMALSELLAPLPSNMPPIVVVQHMPKEFTPLLARRLDAECAVRVSEAKEGDELAPGRVLIAPGDQHMIVAPTAMGPRIRLVQGPAVNFSRPSVDVLFSSVARCFGKQAVGVLLTGMGSDGAKGLLEMRQAGAHTIAQDEESSVVFGMPREATKLGAAFQVISLRQIPEHLLASVA